MTILSDDLVEKAARAAFDKFAESDPAMLHLWDSSAFDREEWIEQTRAALEASLPEIVEKVAAVGWAACSCDRCATDVRNDILRQIEGDAK